MMMDSHTPWILVVEDDANAREGLLMLLARAGFQPRGASNGQEALDLLDGSPAPALILVDLDLPFVTGRELLKYCHDDPALRMVPAIVVTASPDRGELVADEVFLKPVDLPHLLRSIRHAVGEGHDSAA